MGWFYTRTGKYTVKSGYALEQKAWEDGNPPVFGPDTRSLQAHVWKVKCTQKLQHFLWQSLTGCIAVGDRLKSRGIRIDPQCMRCGMAPETVNHSLFECPPALQVWALSLIPTAPSQFPTGSIFTNMAHLFWELPNDDRMGFYPWLVWYIWKSRNDKVLSNVDWDPYDIIAKATGKALSWTKAQEKQETGYPSLDPCVNIILSSDRCQVDGAWKETDCRAGLGWFYFNTDTQCKLMGTRNLRRGISALQTELEALIWAMQCMIRHNKLMIIFETDCSDLVKMVSTPEEWPAFAILLEEIDRCKTRFTSFSIIHIPRANNMKADKLARSARALPTDVYYVNSVSPIWIPELL
ncbi:unnamed protein product [Microthlaspi erraticum]|uniref:RNase H type-1 domain-containing protein n=1 Tax=Microthlaspi erraticum TaxID=1685480 RepID=A0A6D2JEB2_9BRAS|nr:unnamed protein product [Microthlaspi erraticum]